MKNRTKVSLLLVALALWAAGSVSALIDWRTTLVEVRAHQIDASIL